MITVDRSQHAPRYRAITRANIVRSEVWERLPAALREVVMVVSAVLPFRTNPYVLDELINWDRVPDDPMYQLTFPQRGMLDEADYVLVADALNRGLPHAEFQRLINTIRAKMNPHPAGQRTHNVPIVDGEPLPGVQHKYRETVLYFPAQGQTCHAYCSYCFRWPQFVGDASQRFASREIDQLVRYIEAHPAITDVLITGGDPMIMKTAYLEQIITPLLRLDQLISIRVGTKSVAYWPHRFVTDDDADAALRLFDRVVRHDKQLALMGHYSLPVEFEPDMAQAAVQRIRSTGANIRMQCPIVSYVNDTAASWVNLWRRGVQLGCIPYYMFIARDTGARRYFQMPLLRCWQIFREAFQQVSGLARTVRGPVMSAFPGKVHILGVTEIDGQRAFALQYLQARDPKRVRRPFFALLDPEVAWLDDLQPLREADRPMFDPPACRSYVPLHVPDDD